MEAGKEFFLVDSPLGPFKPPLLGYKLEKLKKKKMFFPYWPTPYPLPPLSGLSTKKKFCCGFPNDLVSTLE